MFMTNSNKDKNFTHKKKRKETNQASSTKPTIKSTKKETNQT